MLWIDLDNLSSSALTKKNLLFRMVFGKCFQFDDASRAISDYLFFEGFVVLLFSFFLFMRFYLLVLPLMNIFIWDDSKKNRILISFTTYKRFPNVQWKLCHVNKIWKLLYMFYKLLAKLYIFCEILLMQNDINFNLNIKTPIKSALESHYQ